MPTPLRVALKITPLFNPWSVQRRGPATEVLSFISSFFVSSAGSTTADAIDSVATLTADTTPIDRSGG